MASPRLSSLYLALSFALCSAGPLGPLPNVTSSDLGLKEGSCALGDVVYMPGDEFPGASPCERCTCAAGDVQCVKQRCEPRPGCKAVHRPDHCCPTYQCECEQEGRVYGNGEKLVDPADPCRVCYCQGGEVVCRRIACFVRDDCRPRLVPGRCCPEYDNCPLRGVTSLPGVAPVVSSIPSMEYVESSVPSSASNAIMPEITIKEITPVSEIPVPGVKIKEILPSPSIEVAEYSSSKSPLIPREATSEKSQTQGSPKTEASVVIDAATSPSPLTSDLPPSPSETITDTKTVNDAPPSKISLSTQDSINSEIYPSIVPIIATMGVPIPAILPEEPVSTVLTTKGPMMDEEDPSLFDHNPAFPPIPDDLSVLSHEDEIIPEQSLDGDHVSNEHDVVSTSSFPPSTETPSTKDLIMTTVNYVSEAGLVTTENISESSPTEITTKSDVSSTMLPNSRGSSMINLRSAIPTEILNVPSLIPEDITVESDYATEPSVLNSDVVDGTLDETSTMMQSTEKNKDERGNSFLNSDEKDTHSTEEIMNDSTTHKENTETTASSLELRDQTSSTANSNIVTEINIPSEISSIPIETSDQYSHDITDKAINEWNATTISEPSTTANAPSTTTNAPSTTTNAPSTVTIALSTITDASSTTINARSMTTSAPSVIANAPSTITDTPSTSTNAPSTTTSVPSTTTNAPPTTTNAPPTTTNAPSTFDATTAQTSTTILIPDSPESSDHAINSEATEYVQNSFGSQESVTDAVELIKLSPESEKSSAMIEAPNTRNNNVLTDLINLVGDVASISDHTEGPEAERNSTSVPSTISDSEELIPVNAGYKSKNNNWNLNSITEVPLKNKGQMPVVKQKVVEIEDEDSDSITDSPTPNDKVEPTTRRPIIDNVLDDMSENKSDKKDIEIITQSYVPTIINRRPTKVVMKKSNDKPLSEEASDGVTVLAETTSETVNVPSESTVGPEGDSTSESGESIVEETTTEAPQ